MKMYLLCNLEGQGKVNILKCSRFKVSTSPEMEELNKKNGISYNIKTFKIIYILDQLIKQQCAFYSTELRTLQLQH